MKQRLLTPGPTPVPEETLLELAKPVHYHRGKRAREILRNVLEGLQYLFQTKNTIIPLTCSGTGGLEAAVVNTLPQGSKAICLIAGRFGQRWRSICRAFGVETISVTAPPGRAVTVDQLQQALSDHPDAAAVCTTLSETSTGVAHDIAAFGRLTASTNAVLLVDAISGLGVMDCRTDDWKIDICVTGSQKALMLPPGLAFLSVSDKAWQAIDQNRTTGYYFDLKMARQKLETLDTPFTPAHTLLRALQVSLKRIRERGLESILAYHGRCAAAARAAFLALGLELFASPPANGLTVVKMPEGLDSTIVLERLEQRYGLKLANGQEELKGKIIRLGHMGYIDQFDVLAAISGLELVLNDLGHPIILGAGVTAAQHVFAAASE